MQTIQVRWKLDIISGIIPDIHDNLNMYFLDFPTILPDIFLVAFGSCCSPQNFQIEENTPGSFATPLPGF